MEQWGTGVQRVFEQVAEAGLPEPLIEEVQDRVRVTIYVPSHDPARPPKTAGAATNTGVRVSKSGEQVSKSDHQVESTPERMSKSSEQVSKSSEQVALLLAFAASGSRSRAELLTTIGLTDAYGNYRRHLRPLIEQGYLARTARQAEQPPPALPDHRRRTRPPGRHLESRRYKGIPFAN